MKTCKATMRRIKTYRHPMEDVPQHIYYRENYPRDRRTFEGSPKCNIATGMKQVVKKGFHWCPTYRANTATTMEEAERLDALRLKKAAVLAAVEKGEPVEHTPATPVNNPIELCLIPRHADLVLHIAEGMTTREAASIVGLSDHAAIAALRKIFAMAGITGPSHTRMRRLAWMLFSGEVVISYLVGYDRAPVRKKGA